MEKKQKKFEDDMQGKLGAQPPRPVLSTSRALALSLWRGSKGSSTECQGVLLDPQDPLSYQPC